MFQTARQRRKAIVVLIVLWMTAGQLATWYWRHSLVWVQVQSDLAILLGLLSWFGAETPVEHEGV